MFKNGQFDKIPWPLPSPFQTLEQILNTPDKWTYLQNKNRLTNIESKFMATKGEMEMRG